MKHWIALQVKPAGELCNFNCTYCYNQKLQNKCKVMPDEVLDNILTKYIAYSPNHLTFSWHGGEPTIAGLTFFKKMQQKLHKFKNPDHTVKHLIQTNASLIDNGFAKFFKDNQFMVGVSLDGPPSIHNQNRKLLNGKSSFSSTMKGIKTLQNNGVKFGIICTVSKKSCQFPEEILRFFVKNRFYNISFSPVVYVSNPHTKPDDLIVNNNDWFEFLRDIFYEWCKFNNSKIQIREINEIIAWTIKKPLNFCASGNGCAHWFSIEPNGEVACCEYFNPGISYGNILEHTFDDILVNPGYLEFKKDQSYINPRCKKCKYFALCGNGCSRLRYKTGNFDLEGVYIYCNQRQQLYNEIELYFKKVKNRKERR